MHDAIERLSDALEGRYRVLGELGEGGMAHVYLADDLRHERKVALKVLKAQLAHEHGAQRFQSEIRTTANLQHPHILPLFDSGEVDGFPFYVMPYVEGESLGDLLEREGSISVNEAVRLTVLVASALQYAHDQGVVHRDIKPANIMLSGDLPVVADFGIASLIAEAGGRTEKNESSGTLRYGSPEQLTGDGPVDGRSDLYSLGCVLHEMVSGSYPHAASAPAAILAKRLMGPPPPIRTLVASAPQYLEELLQRALSVSPDDRFETVSAFGAALREGHEREAGQVLKDLGNMPVPSTQLLGREKSLVEIASLLGSARLVTLLGAGGLGKTRLSIEAATRASQDFPDGAWFVDLAAVTDPAAVSSAAAGVFGVTQQPGKTIEQSLADALGGRRLLIVLDNCEHVVDAAASLATALLATCPEVRIIATSRETLSIAGEHVLPVPTLDASPSVALFAERARAVDPSFEVGDGEDVIREICESLDGIPLAIELAAARVRSLSPAQILDRLGERFRLLTRGGRGVETERHQTLHHAVQWSYDLLSDTERAVLARATVFVGGFTLQGGEYVCAGGDVDEFDVLDLLDALVAKSLLTVDRSSGEVRYGMLETIRSFGGARLAEQGAHEEYAVRLRHGEYFARESAKNFEVWRSPRELEAYEWLDAEIANLRVAFRWGLENKEVDVAARIASDVGDMGRFRLHEEAAFWAEEVVDMAREAQHPRLTILLTWSASAAWQFSRFEDAQRFGEEAVALCDNPDFDSFVWAFGDLAFVALFAGDVPRAIELLKEGAAHPTDARDRFMMGFLLYILGTAGHGDECLRLMDDYIAKIDEVAVPMSICVGYGGKGAALEPLDPDAALAAYEHGIEAARSSGNRFMEALLSPRVAALHARSGDPAVALGAFERMLVSFGEMTDIASVAAWRASLVVLLGKLGHAQAAATLHGTIGESVDTSGVVPEHQDAVDRLRGEVGDDAFARAVAVGSAMSLREASNYAIEQVRVALAAIDGDSNEED